MPIVHSNASRDVTFEWEKIIFHEKNLEHKKIILLIRSVPDFLKSFTENELWRVAAHSQSVRTSNCQTLAIARPKLAAEILPNWNKLVRCTHTLGVWRHSRERANCRVRFPCYVQAAAWVVYAPRGTERVNKFYFCPNLFSYRFEPNF